MAIGDDAAAAGYPLVPANGPTGSLGKVRQGYLADNETRDIIARERTARMAADATKQDKLAPAGSSPARREPGSTHSIGFYTNPASALFFRPDPATGDFDRRVITQQELDAALTGIDMGAYLPRSGGTMTGPLYLASAAPVTSGYVAMYRNSDGRVGVTPSAAKYKHRIADYEGSALDLRPVTYVLNGDENETVRLGIVADEANDIEPMLVVHEDGEIESFKYELLAVALLRDVQRLAARVSDLEAAA